jgi:hypothetical protein
MIFKSQKIDIGSPNHVLDQRGLRKFPRASWNFNGEKLVEEVFKWL